MTMTSLVGMTRAELEFELSGAELLLDMADDLEDPSMKKRARKTIRECKARLRAITVAP